jgi:hypothetical protein
MLRSNRLRSVLTLLASAALVMDTSALRPALMITQVAVPTRNRAVQPKAVPRRQEVTSIHQRWPK